MSNAEELDQTTKTIISEAFYLIKGLAIKGSPLSYQAIQKIIENLKSTSDEIRAWIVKNWHILFESVEFSRANKFNISPFYKQRLFSIAFPALIRSYRETQASLQAGHSEEGVPLGLISKLLIPICSESSYELYKDYMGELLPLIIYSLNINDERIKDICLNMIKRLLEQDDQKGLNTEELTANLINCLNDRMSTQTKNLTIICMTMILNTTQGNVMKYKKALVSKVKRFLDDRKRSTRKLAVKCVNDWWLA